MVKTKIIATLGPATDSKTVLRKMVFAGLDVARLNFSHGKTEDHANRVGFIREINKKYRRAIKIMQDLEGYRIRVGKLKRDLLLKKRQTLFLTQENITGKDREIHFDYKGSLKKIKKGNLVYIDDGRLILRVKEVERRRLKTEVISGGTLKENKGINIPEARLDFESLTKKDKEDIKFAIQYRLEYIAQSFVRHPRDINILKEILSSQQPKCKIFAKIESRESLENLDGIIRASDGVIIARGDLGICLPIYKVPIFQKKIIKRCRQLKKPVAVATQMLETMTQEPFPTRAEVSDVANAILDGADFLLLSGETAVGKHPHKAVEIMNRIIKYTEAQKMQF
jgi:pyruvate kinase